MDDIIDGIAEKFAKDCKTQQHSNNGISAYGVHKQYMLLISRWCLILCPSFYCRYFKMRENRTESKSVETGLF